MSGFTLGLDCSGETYSVGLLGPKGERAEVSGFQPRRALRETPEAVAFLLRSQGASYRDLETVGVTSGPGSFTGVRLGVTLAKTIAGLAQAKLVGLDSLRVLAFGKESAAIALDARRGEVYCAVLTNGKVLVPTDVRTPAAFGDLLKDQQPHFLVGAGFEVYPELVPPNWQGPRLTERAESAPRGLAVATLAQHDAGQQADLGHDLRPQYFRRADIQVNPGVGK